MAIQYYNNLFPPIVQSKLSAFSYVPREVNNDCVEEDNYIKYYFSPSVANNRSQFKSALVRVIRGDNNKNIIDRRIYNIQQIPYMNGEIYQEGNEYYVKIPVKYLYNYETNCIGTSLDLLTTNVPTGSLGLTLNNKKCYVLLNKRWEEVNEDNFAYDKYVIDNTYFKIQIRLLPFDIRPKGGSFTEYQVKDDLGDWFDLNEQWLNNKRNFISEYSAVTYIKPVYKPKLSLVGRFTSMLKDSSGNYYYKQPSKEDGINIISSSFYEFVGSYNNYRDIDETLSKYQFLLYDYKTREVIEKTEEKVPTYGTINWKSMSDLSNGSKYWLELRGETLNGLKISTRYILEVSFTPIKTLIGFEVEGNADFAKNTIKLNGRQIRFVPKDDYEYDEVYSHEFNGEYTKIKGTYITEPDLDLIPEKAYWVGQSRVKGITPEVYGFVGDELPEDTSFFRIYNDDVKYELRAVYNRSFQPDGPSSYFYIKDRDGLNYRCYVDGFSRIICLRTFDNVNPPEYYNLSDIGPDANLYWQLVVIKGRLSLRRYKSDEIEGIEFSDKIVLEKTYGEIGISVYYERLVIVGPHNYEDLIRKYTNQFELTKISSDGKQKAISSFVNRDGTFGNDWKKITDEQEYYFYFGDYYGTPYLYSALLEGENSYKLDWNNSEDDNEYFALTKDDEGNLYSISIANYGKIQTKPFIRGGN